MAHLLFHLNRWLTAILLLSPDSALVHSHLCLILIPTARLRSLSRSIVVDVMTTVQMEDTDNLNGHVCLLMQLLILRASDLKNNLFAVSEFRKLYIYNCVDYMYIG